MLSQHVKLDLMIYYYVNVIGKKSRCEDQALAVKA